MTGKQGRFEHSDADARPVFLAGLVLALVLGAAMAASAWIAQRMSEEAHADDVPNPVRALREEPEGPKLQSVPARELAQHRAAEERLLGATEWIDPVNGIVRIPVERAMELVLAEGFPVRAEEDR